MKFYDTYLPDFTNITIVIEVSKLCWVGLIPTENNMKKINKRKEMHWITTLQIQIKSTV